MDWIYNDGGRAFAGRRGEAGDCYTRAVAIVTGLPYQEVYDATNQLARLERPRGGGRRSNARKGVHARRTGQRYLESLGWIWHPTMQIGQGCTIHLRADELPAGRILVQVSKHFTAVVDGVIHDTFDPSRDGTRCVYGYWTAPEE
jgi:hypothetical protein